MDARTIDDLENADSSAETRHLSARWRNIVKSGVYRQSDGRWKTYHEPVFLRTERMIIEEQFQHTIGNIHNRRQQHPAEVFQPQARSGQ